MTKNPARTPSRAPQQRRTAQPAPKRRWRLPLHSLVRLNWDGMQEVPPQTSAPANVESVRLNDQEYRVEALESDHTAYVRLEPRRHYLAVPLNEPDQPQRYLLVRQQKSFSADRTYLVVSQPAAGEAATDDGATAHIHILGGYVDKPDSLSNIKEPSIVGVAEAILTPLDMLQSEEPVESPVDQPRPALEPPLPLDEDLLHCIDVLNHLLERYPDAAGDIAAAQRQFYEYVQRRYNLSVISITRGETAFDEQADHWQAGTSRFSKVADGIITAIHSDGYRHSDNTPARPAQVVVNQHATQVVKLGRLIMIRPGRLFVEIHAPEDLRRKQVFQETAQQSVALDQLYAWLAVYATARADDFQPLIEQPDQPSLSDDRLRDMLLRVHNWPLRLIYQYRSSQLYLIMRGEAAALQALHRILQAEAQQREGAYRAEPDWPLAELRQLRPNAPPGLKIQEFNDLTGQFLAKIRELLDQITFAPEFVQQKDC